MTRTNEDVDMHLSPSAKLIARLREIIADVQTARAANEEAKQNLARCHEEAEAAHEEYLHANIEKSCAQDDLRFRIGYAHELSNYAEACQKNAIIARAASVKFAALEAAKKQAKKTKELLRKSLTRAELAEGILQMISLEAIT